MPRLKGGSYAASIFVHQLTGIRRQPSGKREGVLFHNRRSASQNLGQDLHLEIPERGAGKSRKDPGTYATAY